MSAEVAEPPPTAAKPPYRAAWPAVLGLTNATLTIIDNDFSPGILTFSAPSYRVSEGDTNAVVTVLRASGEPEDARPLRARADALAWDVEQALELMAGKKL